MYNIHELSYTLTFKRIKIQINNLWKQHSDVNKLS